MAPKKTAENKALKELKTALEKGRPENLYIFHGPEDYLREHYLERLKKCVLTEGMESFNLHVFQGKSLELTQLIEAVEAFPMMSERSLVLVYDWDLFQNKERMERLVELFSDLPDYVCLVFLYETQKWSGNANTKLGKLLKTKAQIVEFQEQSQSDLNAWIRRQLKKRWDKDMDNETANYLTFLCGGLMTNLAGELDKLGAYTGGKWISKGDIDAVCDPVLEAKAFQMTDAIAGGEYGKAMELTRDLLRMGEEPIYILAALGRQLRQIWSARLAYENKKSEGYLAQLWGMKSDWQARKLFQAGRSHSRDWCRRAVKLAQEADYAMKSGRNGKEVLVELILELAVCQ